MKFRNCLKRFGMMCLSLAMVMAMAAPAFAADDPTKDVTGTYSGEGKPVYSYGYSWGSMEWTYSGDSNQVWDPTTHQYKMSTSGNTGGWSCASGANEITIMNHSNAPIKVQLGFTAALNGFLGGFTKNNFTIASAVGTQVDNPPSETVQFGPAEGNTAVLSAGQTNVKLGTITLHVTGA